MGCARSGQEGTLSCVRGAEGVVTVLNNRELCRGEKDNLQVLPGAFYYLGLEGPLQAGHGARAGRGRAVSQWRPTQSQNEQMAPSEIPSSVQH